MKTELFIFIDGQIIASSKSAVMAIKQDHHVRSWSVDSLSKKMPFKLKHAKKYFLKFGNKDFLVEGDAYYNAITNSFDGDGALTISDSININEEVI